MKTAISVPDELLLEADRAAHEIGVSRSRLVSLALENFLRVRRQEAVLAQLNRVYSGAADPAEERATARMKRKFRRAIRERW